MGNGVKNSIDPDPVTGHPPHYFHEMPHEDEERLEKLFNSLDLDGKGKIDIHDLSEALKKAGLHHGYAEKFLRHSDTNKSGDISLAEFIHYVKEHEKNLRLGFSHLDKNRDGKIDLEELVKAFSELGVEIDHNEARKLLQRMDKDGSLEISFNEWRDYLLYAPTTDIRDLINYWRHSTPNSLASCALCFVYPSECIHKRVHFDLGRTVGWESVIWVNYYMIEVDSTITPSSLKFFESRVCLLRR
ncbi:unnamed protein product [Bemisia tabaci]|uniref:EF-hand domain-containing protein n=1 Tax=Bemisia tabaci TaxID=7038 RepID=A0A9P0A3Y0_BEMTA|nr:unnamed protein product [Bemisia tabaci]